MNTEVKRVWRCESEKEDIPEARMMHSEFLAYLSGGYCVCGFPPERFGCRWWERDENGEFQPVPPAHTGPPVTTYPAPSTHTMR